MQTIYGEWNGQTLNIGFAVLTDPVQTTYADAKPSRRQYACASCGRTLPHERWVYSRHTAARYCTPGEGCQTPDAYAKQDRFLDKQDRQRAKARKEG